MDTPTLAAIPVAPWKASNIDDKHKYHTFMAPIPASAIKDSKRAINIAMLAFPMTVQFREHCISEHYVFQDKIFCKFNYVSN